jgi:hypothetical protein
VTRQEAGRNKIKLGDRVREGRLETKGPRAQLERRGTAPRRSERAPTG